MRQEPRDGINGLAAQVNAAHGRGVGHPIRHPARFNSCRPPSSAGVCDHGKQSVGEAQVYSASLPLHLRGVPSPFWKAKAFWRRLRRKGR